MMYKHDSTRLILYVCGMMKYVIHVSLKFSEVSRFGKWPFMLVLLLSLAEVWPAVC